MSYSRRDLTILLPALAVATAEAQKTAPAEPSPSRTYPYEELIVKTSAGNRSLAVIDAHTHTGYHFDMHETELGPGNAPHPPHHHEHEEMIMIRQGTLEVTIAGKSKTLGPGSVAYVASNEEHGWRNTGSGLATYFVIAFGRP